MFSCEEIKIHIRYCDSKLLANNFAKRAIKDNDYMEIVGSQIVELDNEICGKCTCCGAWTSNQDNEECVSSFSDGCCIDGKWLCDICLPSEHPKSF